MSEHACQTVEITGSSPDGVTEAINDAIAKAAKAPLAFEWFEVVGVRGHIGDAAAAHFQVSLKVGFPVED